MARYTRLQVWDRCFDSGLVPVFNHSDPEFSLQIIQAVMEGGATVLEFTHRSESAPQVFQYLADQIRKKDLDIALGIGSVIDEATAANYINSGADFIVSPVFQEQTARMCNRRKIGYVPGCGTVTEISQAEEMGAEICKIFPGESVGGPGFVKAVKGPMPWVRLMPTGGVDNTEESIGEWLRAGACCLGMGSKLLSKQSLQNRDMKTIQGNVEKALSTIQKVRGESI